MTSTERKSLGKARTGVAGLDDILAGGLQRGRVYLIEGSPGTGKTTIATQILMEGAAAGERGLYITLSETEEELRETRRLARLVRSRSRTQSSSWCPRKTCSTKSSSKAFSIPRISNSERRRSGFSRRSRSTSPDRLVLDSLSEIRLLAQSSLRYRRQVLALKHYFARSGATVVMLDDMTTEYSRQDRAQHRSWRHPPGGTGARLRCRAAADAGDQVSRAALPRRVPRSGHQNRRRSRVSKAGLGRAQKQLLAREPAFQFKTTQRAARRRDRTWIEHLGAWSCRDRQVAADPELCGRRRSLAARRPRCSSSTRSLGCFSNAPKD